RSKDAGDRRRAWSLFHPAADRSRDRLSARSARELRGARDEIPLRPRHGEEARHQGVRPARILGSLGCLSTVVPGQVQGCPGNDSLCHGACPAVPAQTGTFWLSRLRKGPGMQFRISILASLLKPISRRRFAATVERHDGDAYDKSFRSWDQLVT